MACKYNCSEGMAFVPALGKSVPCPECSNAGDIFEKTPEQQKDILKSLNIPTGFDLTILYDEQLFNIQSVQASFSPDSINAVKEKLIQMNTSVMNGKVLKESIYLYTPAVDIKAFAYAHMVKGVENGLKVAPLLTVNTLYEIQRSREFDFGSFGEVYNGEKGYDSLSEREKQYYDGYVTLRSIGRTYSELLTNDILFLEATANTSNVSWVAVADIMAERATRNLPTYILGYWGSRQLQGSNAKYILQTSEWSKRLNKMTVVELTSKGRTQQNNTGTWQGGNHQTGHYGGQVENQQRQPYTPKPQYERQAISSHISQHMQNAPQPPKQQSFGIGDYENI